LDKKWFTLKIAILVYLLSSLTAIADEDNLPIELSLLKRCARAELKAFRLFNVGYAALYKEKCKAKNIIFDKSTKRLRFVYEREIPAQAFREASEEYLEINLGKKYETWKLEINQFNQAYRDIKQGDYYDLIYDAKAGLKLHLNDSLLATLDDPEIGLAYFNIWFGKEPFSEELKNNLTISKNL